MEATSSISIDLLRGGGRNDLQCTVFPPSIENPNLIEFAMSVILYEIMSEKHIFSMLPPLSSSVAGLNNP